MKNRYIYTLLIASILLLSSSNEAAFASKKDKRVMQAYGRYMKLHEPEEKIKAGSVLFKIAPESKYAYNVRAYKAYVEKDYNAALQHADKMIEIDKTFAYGYSMRSAIKLKMGNVEGGLKDINIALKYDSNDVFNYADKADIYIVHFRKYKKALDIIELGLKKEPWKSARAHTIKGMCHLRMGEYEKAIVSYSNALKVSKKYYSANALRGRCYYLLFKWEKAIKDLTITINHYPRHKGYFSFLRGVSYFKVKDYNKAKKDLRVAMDDEDSEPAASYYYGTILIFEGKEKEGIRYIRGSADKGFQPAVESIKAFESDNSGS